MVDYDHADPASGAEFQALLRRILLGPRMARWFEKRKALLCETLFSLPSEVEGSAFRLNAVITKN
jgi:hypothetical protein